MLEVKREDFDPRKARGKERARFERQLATLRAVNAAGAAGFWVRSGPDALAALLRVLEGASVEIDAEGYCWLTVRSDPRRPGTSPGWSR